MLLLAAPSVSTPARRAADRVIDRAVAAHRAAPHDRRGEALAGLALRFGTPEPAVVRRPAPGADWTLAETLGEIERRGVRLVVSSRGLKVSHANRLPDVARNVARHETAVAMWLSLREDTAPAPFDARAWDPAVQLYAAWFALRFEAPPAPFTLRPGETCCDAAKLREGIAGRLAAGPLAESAVRLRSELVSLFDRYALGVVMAPSVPVAMPRRRAA